MALYEFIDDQGNRIERYERKMPRLGKKIVVNGKVFTRIVSSGIQGVGDIKPFVSYSMPKGMPGRKTDKNGRTVYETRRAMYEDAKKMGMEEVGDTDV
jgi:hypothetical protein